ncbi:MAG: 23S rRNA (pseudouridine(1915)-N(3))-methyltransferase RlmH [Geminicoccaceae bacterium]
MRVTIAAVGRDRSGPTRELFDDYCRRCSWPIRLIEIAPRSALPRERRLAAEGARLSGAIPRDATLIVLDERGRALSSRSFAARIGAWQQQSRSELAFLIGGPDGLAADVIQRAELVLALGRMTWPHLLVRVLLAEQLYRASTILAGHPYHRD